MEPSLESFRDWVPIRVYRNGSELRVDWCYAGSTRFTRPFFDDSIQEMLRRPFSVLFRHQTSIDFLGELSAAYPGIAPSGFIFHMSRCGSTLVAQMLASLGKNIVISEAPPIDTAIQLDSVEYLTSMINVLGRPRTKDEQHYFIKFDSWNTLDLPMIRAAFPDVPWILLYRNPVEVIVSHMRQRGSQMVPGNHERPLAGLTLEEALKISPEEYCARVLAPICSTALENAEDQKALLLNYDQLPGAVTGVMLDHFGVSFRTDEIAQMEATAMFNAKTPSLNFEPDAESKRAEANEAARNAAAEFVDPIYHRLEEIRLGRSL